MPITKDINRHRDPLLRIDQLAVSFDTPVGPSRAVSDVSLTVRRGEVLGVVGESGSGKSMTAMSIIGLLPPGAHVEGSVVLDGLETSKMSDRDLRKLRGRVVGTIFQDPLSSLNPIIKVGKQLIEAIRVHEPERSRQESRAIAIELLDRVGITNPADRMNVYPHELSGGMRQRVVIAQAIANRPALLIADEPTTALDVTTQVQVLNTLEDVRASVNAAMILISHDLGVIADTANRVAVMYNGRLVEVGPIDDVLNSPQHPYTAGLLRSRPTLETGRGELLSIRGVPPRGTDSIVGCAFADRCDRKTAEAGCETIPPHLEDVDDRGLHQVSCHLPGPDLETARLTTAVANHSDRLDPSPAAPESGGGPPASRGEEPPVLVVEDLVKRFPLGRGRRAETLTAVDEVSIGLQRGQTVAVVGESGCGKTTLARSILRLTEPDSGRVEISGTDVRSLSRGKLRRFRTHVQIVFQDPTSALNPRLTVGDLIAEPMLQQGLLKRSEKRRRVAELLETVSMFPEHASRYPSELSGGQRQRVSIARALGLEPDVLVLDEPVSAVDVSVQAQILRLLTDLQGRLGVGYLFISHDLGVVHQLADTIVVMYRGRVVEQGSAQPILANPVHPYTQLLVASVPGSGIKDPAYFEVEGTIPSLRSGCLFADRCPLAEEACSARVPALEDVAEGHAAACLRTDQARNRYRGAVR